MNTPRQYKINFESKFIKTLTVGCGKEFAGYLDLEPDLKANIYFVDNYSYWQRGTNENTN